MNLSHAPLRHSLKRFLMHWRRRAYGLRAFVPGLREHHRLEAMVGPLGYWSQLQRYHLQLLQANGLKPDHTLLDIGCGPLQGGVAFIGYLERNRYTGLDIDPTRIAAAREQVTRHRLAAKEPRLLVSSSFGQAELGGQTFDFMWASQILYYFNDAAMDALLGMIRQRLNPGGKFLGDVFAPDHYEFRYPEHAGKYVRHTPESLQAQAARHGLHVRSLGVIGQFGYPKRLSLKTNLLFEITP
jgi:SAM-dependent methyltransferase